MRRRYPVYRDSGVDWCEMLPSHWRVVRLKYTGQVVMGQSPPSSSYDDMPGQRPFLQGNAEFSLRYPMPRIYCDTATQTVPIGTLLMSVRAPVGAMNIADQPYGIGRGLCGFIPSPEAIERQFAWWVLRVARHGLKSIVSGSIFESVSAAQVGDLLVCLPPPPEQRAISSFLESETARIDGLISKQEMLIERLEEYRTALITQTVTHGLPPDAAEAAGLDPAPPLMDSGVDWLGEVPEHWQVAQLCRTVLFQRGHDLPVDDREPGAVPVVSSAGVTGGHIEAAAVGPAIVTGRYGSIGNFYVVDGSFWPLNTTLYSIDLFGNDVIYVSFLLMSLKPLFLANAEKSAVPGVDRNDIHDILVATPPRHEQHAIVEYLDEAAGRIDTLKVKAEDSIERLREYRSALVSAAVTGKIDVRESAVAGSGGGG